MLLNQLSCGSNTRQWVEYNTQPAAGESVMRSWPLPSLSLIAGPPRRYV